jgi:hypothetical protein
VCNIYSCILYTDHCSTVKSVLCDLPLQENIGKGSCKSSGCYYTGLIHRNALQREVKINFKQYKLLLSRGGW